MYPVYYNKRDIFIKRKRLFKIQNAMKALLAKARNVRDIKHIASLCADNPGDFDNLLKCMEGSDPHLGALAAWAMSHAVSLRPDILKRNHFDRMVGLAGQTTHSALKRNILRAWQMVELPGELQYSIADIALKFLSSSGEDIAVKAFSITVLQNCLKQIPELKEEILFILEREMPHASAAYIVRAGKFMKAAAKIRSF
jgi:hypothetical protein